MPILEVDGKAVIPQSRAIENYLAEAFGFRGANDIEGAQVEAITEQLRDLTVATREANNGGDAKKAEWYSENGGLAKGLALLEKALEKGKNGYFVGGKLSLADIVTYHILSAGLGPKEAALAAPVIAKFPHLVRLRDQVGANERIAAYVAKRNADAAKPTLIYFDGRGRGELARLLFTVAGQGFHDRRMKTVVGADGKLVQEEWMKSKASGRFPFLQMPVLEIDGVTIAQSRAIENLLARKFGLLGSNDVEATHAEAIVEQWRDVIYKHREEVKDEAKKAQWLAEGGGLDHQLGLFEKQLERGKNGYFVGGNLSLADIATFNYLCAPWWEGVYLGPFEPVLTLVKRHPHLHRLIQKVGAHERIAPYIAKRDAPKA